MPRRRPLRGWNQRQVSAMESMIPGTIGGRVSSAAPVLSASDVLAEQAGDVGVSELVTGEGYQVDEFDLDSDGAQDLTLTYLPIEPHEHLFLRTLHRQKGLDWTRSGQTVSLAAGISPRAGDHVTVEYAYLAGAPVAPADSGEVNIPFATGGWKYHTVTDGADVATWVDPAFDDSAWPEGTPPIGLTGFTDLNGHPVATVVPPDNTGALGHVLDLVVRRRLTAGTGIDIHVDMSNYCDVYVDGVLAGSSATGFATEFHVTPADQTASWVLALYLIVANGATTGGIDIEVTGTET